MGKNSDILSRAEKFWRFFDFREVDQVYGDKVNGLIVDYANVFPELEKALVIYGSGMGGDELPVKDKKELVEALTHL